MKFGSREGIIVPVCFVIIVVVVVSVVYSNGRSYHSCRDVPGQVSGKYSIRGKGVFGSFEAYCEQESYGGGWMVIQHRFDGSLSFDRNWRDYKNGFGDVDGEHWLGLEKVHQLTKEQDYELRIELRDFENKFVNAKYNSFRIGSESEQYRLISLGAYSGREGDSMRIHQGMKFSTLDRDNDQDIKNSCAKVFHGGWWFKSCFTAFLNGIYSSASGEHGNKIIWLLKADGSTDLRPYKYSRMLIRPLN